MNRLAPPHHGTMLSAGYLVDHAQLGVAEALRRVLHRWRPGASVYTVDAERWLLILSEPELIRCAAAPGLPVAADDLRGGAFRFTDGGRSRTVELDALPALDPAAWLTTDHLLRRELVACEPPVPPPTTLEVQQPVRAIDLRAVARVGRPSKRANEAAKEIAGRGGSAGTGEAGARPPRDRLARLLMGSPAGPQIARRHRAYLEALASEFEKKNYDKALRDAIGLGGKSAYLSLRLPTRRSRVGRPSTQAGRGGGAMPLGRTAAQRLRDLYRAAAEDLERQGRHQEAAFVLADLMASVPEAVALLERHGQFAFSAELAEGRDRPPAEVVRLWWRAGERDRAVAVAKARGAYAAAITRLEKVDTDAARELRVAWATSLSGAGDFVGAVQVAWTDRELRPRAQRDIALGCSLGGDVAAHLFAYQLAIGVNAAALATALALIATHDPAVRGARSHFLAAFADLPCADPAADRQLATAALRSVLGRQSPVGWDSALRRTVQNALRKRADPLLKEDLPTGLLADDPTPTGPVTVTLVGPPGQLAVHDAVPMAGGALLVAHGPYGVRLLGPGGKVRAHWDVPAHQIVVAHHGGSAVVATDLGQQSWELHRFDLASRRLHRWVVVRAARLVATFDGLLFAFVDTAGTLVFLDAQSARARVIWTEVNDTSEVLDVAAGATSMAALVHHRVTGDSDRTHEVWQWELPQRVLRGRHGVDVQNLSDAAVTSDGRLLCVRASERQDDGVELYALTPTGRVALTRVTEGAGLSVSGASHALRTADSLDVVCPGGAFTVRAPGAGQLSFRSADDRAVVWDDRARLGVVELSTGQLVMSVSVTT